MAFLHAGMVMISPSGIVSVCQGDQLELTYNTTGSFLRWEVNNLFSEKEITARTYTRSFSSIGASNYTELLRVNSTMFTFSRRSAQGNLPLISRLLIQPVSEGLNRTEVNCVDVITSESAVTTIHIIGGKL